MNPTNHINTLQHFIHFSSHPKHIHAHAHTHAHKQNKNSKPMDWVLWTDAEWTWSLQSWEARTQGVSPGWGHQWRWPEAWCWGWTACCSTSWTLNPAPSACCSSVQTHTHANLTHHGHSTYALQTKSLGVLQLCPSHAWEFNIKESVLYVLQMQNLLGCWSSVQQVPVYSLYCVILAKHNVYIQWLH